MKKICFLLSLLVALVVSSVVFVSCGDDEELTPLGTIPNGVKAVDLGLPSGTLWANMNVGAVKEEGFGYYFAWGETEPKSDYETSTYKWYNGDFDKLTKYCNYSSYGYNGFTDNLTELKLSDDAAYVNWGSGWRMPSEEQFEELINSNYTTAKWTKQNGVKGYRITSMKNGNSIFLPAAGYRSPSSLSGGSGPGAGWYWSRTLGTSSPRSARYLEFHGNFIESRNDSRYLGYNIRPVRNTE